ncbi:Fur family transcriptional regulator [Actinomadura flavalba]|uniref:Fur family transcriptional regulator n=1 Tax=Actinomadura flavalba TaxID=1120938 RepID=UPI00039B73AE|nr:Fur family transcriptional regulator [Actinomadura flavalba]
MSGTQVRTTKQRLAVQRLLAETPEFQSAQTLHHRLRTQGSSVGLSTMYRTLQSLAAAGEIDMTYLPGGEAVFRKCRPGHHHHLVCRSCGTTVEVEGPELEDWVARVGTGHGFTETEHTVEIFGKCATCSAKKL